MRRSPLFPAFALILACSGHAALSADPPTSGELAPAGDTYLPLARGALLLPGLDTVHRQVTTSSRRAQAFFDQGLALTYGFNHDEAARSYARAAELDPQCAMCLWGIAYTLGPNYNLPMMPGRAQATWDALTRAQEQVPRATPVEAALIAALAQRYSGPEEEARPLNEAYARAMGEVARRFPEDLDVQVLYAESLMNLRPWRLWTPEGSPEPGTEELVATLESVLARAPEHPGANHYYIHAVEASPWPERGLPAAERLGGLVPGAGHLVHMPAHIFQRVGRYADAAEANRRAIVVDRRYLQQTDPPGHYAIYISHNYAFLAYATAMQGRASESLQAAYASAEALPHELVRAMPGMDVMQALPLVVMVRFGLWDEVSAAPKPVPEDTLHLGLWHHARGMALASRGALREARAEAAAIRTIAADMPEELLAGQNSGRRVLAIAAHVVDARAAEVERAPDAISRWERAVELADQLGYNEPADWFYPLRHYLGAALLDLGQAQHAAAVYKADLERNPHNGWALYGLWRALAAQGLASAPAAEQHFRDAWRGADMDLQRSAF